MPTEESLTNVSSNAPVNNNSIADKSASPIQSQQPGALTESPKGNGKRNIFIAIALFIGLMVLIIGAVFVVKKWETKTESNANLSTNTNHEVVNEINLTTTLLATIPDEYIKGKYDIRGSFLDYGKKAFWYAYSQVPSETPHIVILNGDVNNKTEHYNIFSGSITAPLIYQKHTSDNKYTLSIDDKDYPLDNFPVTSILTAKTGGGYTTAYIKQSFGAMGQVVINGVLGKEYKAIWGLAMSKDGKHIAYVTSSESSLLGQTTLIVDGQEKSTKYNLIVLPTFSPNGESLAYFAVSGMKASDKDSSNVKCVAVVDEKESPIECSELLFLLTNPETTGEMYSPYILFSPDSKQIAFMVEVGGQAYISDPQGSYVLLNGKKEKQYKGIGAISFSPDSKNLAYLATTSNNKMVIVINGQEREIERPVNSNVKIVWSPDSKKLAYPNGRDYITMYDMDTKKFEIKKLSSYFPNLQFSADGKQLLFIRETLVPNGSLGSFNVENDIVDFYSETVVVENGESFVFSGDGKHLAARVSAFKDSSVPNQIIIDAKKGAVYDEIWTEPRFSLDGKFVGYGVKKGSELWWIVDPVN